ncbi:MAG: TIGR03560 family F420-dependent LLM class oxidoreductase [Anaerolineales bacterium]|nr:TIGR03560 family F420-dependent LLM class oxidoreductase [Anaerolineales bacterium]MCW5838343.1 TIGR03560 family F420-dependent LLM class oxidoreductase [Anaerolineales bacterium]
MQLSIMIEGQDGLTWPRWQRLAAAAEDFGFAGLYRSDHYTNMDPPEKDSLELWTSLTWLASHTQRIHFGPLVSPLSFRHPSMTARIAAAVDDLSGGRLVLGLGAGWQVREHEMFGLELLELPARMQRFEEGLHVIHSLLHNAAPLDFAGTFYQLQQAVLLPRPQRPGGPPLLVGGNGKQRTLQLAARYASEWNGVGLSAAAYAERMPLLDGYLAALGRPPQAVKRSLMTRGLFGRSSAELASRLAASGRSLEEWRARGALVGEANALVEQLGTLAAAGCQQVMLQWLDQDDIAGLEALAAQVLPQLATH